MEPLVMADIPTLPRVSLETICSTSLAAQSSSYERAVETLAVSIAKYHCAVISTSDRLALGQHNLWQVLQAPRSRRASLLPGGGQSELVTVAYDPKLRRDTLNARIAGSNAIDDDAATQELSESYKQIFCRWDDIARTVLRAMCRSCQLRLRSDTFSPMLDDMPLPAHAVSSSVMSFSQHSMPMPTRGSTSPIALSEHGNTLTCNGVLSLLLFSEATNPQGNVVSSTQVCAADGRWLDVTTGPHEVLVVLGQTLHHATAGVLPATSYRVVGDTTTANPRWEMAYELCAQPGALLDFTPALQAAGHIIPTRFRGPVTMSQLMQQLEGLMTPPSGRNHPHHGRGAHDHHQRGPGTMTSGRRGPGASGGSVRGYMSVEMVKRGTKRGALTDDMPMSTVTPMSEWQGDKPAHATNRPMTRQRSALAMGGRSGGDGGAGEGRGGSAAGVPRGVRPLEVARVTITLGDGFRVGGGGGDKENRHAATQLLIIAVTTVTGSELWFKLHPDTPCGRVFEEFTAHMGQDLGAVKFMFNGSRVLGSSTPGDLGLCNGDRIVMLPVHT